MQGERHLAPELDGGIAWLNTDRPLRLEDLRGQVVLLDFWTYCCVNCMHVLPVLAELEERHRADPVVVIGVHSAKFTGEKDPQRIADAIERYGVRHPVVVDSELRIWRAFAIRSWPTLVVIRPDGTLAAVAPGEPEPAMLERFVSGLLDEAREDGSLAAAPVLALAPRRAPTGPLSFPGKLVVGSDGRIAVSDSGHHRVVLLDDGGRTLATIGSGLRGAHDGSFAEASFDDPQGLALTADGRTLFVADARAHVVRRVDLAARTVTTIAGTGALGGQLARGPTPACTTALRSPWDLALDESAGLLYIAMAGSHQLFTLTLADARLELLAGSGAESIDDGPFEHASFSQPSGLALSADRGTLYVADSETSAIRALDLGTRMVRTLVGRGLFEFGDIDGPADRALLQHCLGLCLTPAGLVVADSYNHKLRLVDPATGAVTTLARGLAEPAGVVWDATTATLLVADTNHGRLVRVSLDGRVVPCATPGLAPPVWFGVADVAPAPVTPPALPLAVDGWFTALLELAEGEGLAPGAARIVLELRAPVGTGLAAGSPLTATLEVSRRPDLLAVATATLALTATGSAPERLPITLTVRAEHAVVEAELVCRLDYVLCESAERGLCIPGRTWLRIPVRLLAAGGIPELRFRVPLPRTS